jgi:hypothetical protein
MRVAWLIDWLTYQAVSKASRGESVHTNAIFSKDPKRWWGNIQKDFSRFPISWKTQNSLENQ